MRRAPKKQVKVESAPLPAPRPRGYSPPMESDPASLDPFREDSASAVSATDTRAPVTGSQETVAPFSSVLRENKDKHAPANGQSNIYSYQARTTVEELPEESEASPSPPSPPPPPRSSTSAAAQEGRAIDAPAAPAVPSGTDRGAAAGLTTRTPKTGGTVGTEPSGTIPAEGGATRSPKLSGPAAAVEEESGRPAVSAAAKPDLDGADAKQSSSDGGAGGDNSIGSGSRAALGEKVALPPLNGRTETKDKAAPVPVPTPQTVRPATDARSPGSPTKALELPTTGYQFELMWRSTDGWPQARLELLRAVPRPPSQSFSAGRRSKWTCWGVFYGTWGRRFFQGGRRRPSAGSRACRKRLGSA